MSTTTAAEQPDRPEPARRPHLSEEQSDSAVLVGLVEPNIHGQLLESWREMVIRRGVSRPAPSRRMKNTIYWSSSPAPSLSPRVACWRRPKQTVRLPRRVDRRRTAAKRPARQSDRRARNRRDQWRRLLRPLVGFSPEPPRRHTRKARHLRPVPRLNRMAPSGAARWAQMGTNPTETLLRPFWQQF